MIEVWGIFPYGIFAPPVEATRYDDVYNNGKGSLRKRFIDYLNVDFDDWDRLKQHPPSVIIVDVNLW